MALSIDGISSSERHSDRPMYESSLLEPLKVRIHFFVHANSRNIITERIPPLCSERSQKADTEKVKFDNLCLHSDTKEREDRVFLLIGPSCVREEKARSPSICSESSFELTDQTQHSLFHTDV